MAIPGKLEAAFDPDLDADPLSWTYTDFTSRTQDNAVTITRGQSARASSAQSASLKVKMDNGDGALTPYKAGTAYYPNMRQGLIVRHSLNTGARWLALTGAASSNATTPDAATWNLGADGGFAIQFRSPVRLPPVGTTYEVYGQSTNAGNQRSWLIFLNADGLAGIRVSGDGATETDLFTSLPLPRPDAGPLTLGIEFEGDNGASGKTATWYLLKDDITALLADKTAYLFGDAYVSAGAITLFNSTGTVGIGDVPGAGFAPYPGGVDAWYTRAGTLTSGTVVADTRNLPAQNAGAGSFADQAGTPKTWAINSPAAITDRKIRLLGTLDANSSSYPGQGTAGTAVRNWQISGPLRRMRLGDENVKSALYRRITATVNDVTVYGYFPLEDGSDATSIFSPIGGTGSTVLTASLASDSSLAASQPLPEVSGGAAYGWNLRMSPDAPTTGWEATWFIKIPTQPTGSEIIDQRIDTIGGTTTQWILRMDNAGYILFAKDNTDPPTNVLTAPAAVLSAFYGEWMVVTVFVTQNGADIDWSVELFPIGSDVIFGTSGTLAAYTLGHPVGFRTLSAAAPASGFSFGHFMITTGGGSQWLRPADTAYAGEPAMARVFRLCREFDIPVLVDGVHESWEGPIGWPKAVAAGAKTMGAQRAGKLLDLINECVEVEDGLLGESRELLALTARSGATLVNQTPRLSVGSEVTKPLAGSTDDKDLVNEATVTRTNGSTEIYTATGAAAPSEIGFYAKSKTLNVEKDSDLVGAAAWWVHETTWPEERYDTIPVELAKNTTKIDDWHDFAPGDVIEATAVPSAEALDTLTQIVDGWSETISPHLWTLKTNTRPAGPWMSPVLDANPAAPDTDLARIDSRGTTLTGSLNTTATGGQSVTVTGTTWTTSASYFPMDIIIDGEVITLSGISSATSPQTFTISARSVNGVVSAHSAGAEIHPATPFRIARAKAFP